MPSIRSFTMTCEEVNDYGTFSEGDTVRGQITLVLMKDTTVDSFFVKCKGDASVRWTTKSGDRTHTYSANRRYFKLKHSIIDENAPDKLVPQGTHVYDFSFTLPTGSLPSTYRGTYGKIIYMVEAKLSRSWKMTRTLEKELQFVSKAIPTPASLMLQQVGSTDKEMGLFSRGSVHMDVTVDRHGYAPGDTVAVVAKINNASSKDMVPKFSLVQNVFYHAQGSGKHECNVISKMTDEPMRPDTQKTATYQIKIPRDLTPTINNCEILMLEYHLKVYLDISFASDPGVKFPVTICHPELISDVRRGISGGSYPSSNLGPSPAGAFGGSPIHNMHGPTVPMGTQPYGYHGAHNYVPPHYPAQPTYCGSPPQPGYGDPYTAPSSTLHPPPIASGYHPSPSAPEFPTLPPSTPSAPPYNFQPSGPPMNTDFLSQVDEAPPSYSILFPNSASDKSSKL